MKIRTYGELSKLLSFDERYNYLKLSGKVGETTFGFDRYLNQVFYRSYQWTSVRNKVIVRDNGCDLGVPGYEIHDRVIIHHMNAITQEDIEERREEIFNPEFLICVSHKTHMAIHYGDKNLLYPKIVVRRPGDTNLW